MVVNAKLKCPWLWQDPVWIVTASKEPVPQGPVHFSLSVKGNGCIVLRVYSSGGKTGSTASASAIGFFATDPMRFLFMSRLLVSAQLAALLAALLFPFGVAAKSATELFESVSNSIVVVYAQNSQGETQGHGSGVVFAAGEVVTNCHVVEKSARFAVKHRNREYPATLKHTDHDRDVCSLTVTGLNAPAATLGSTSPLKVGQKVFAIGAPQGLELTLSDGIISSLREVKGGRYLQISAPISPGSSGGGLFDEEGRLIGLPTFYLAEGQALNFAVPVEWVKELPQRQTAAPQTGQSSLTWLNKAIELDKKKDWPALLRHTQAWTKAQPNDAIAWFSLGIAYGNSGQTAQAIEAYQQALRIDPEDAKAWYGLGITYGESGQTAQAIEAFQQVLRIDPEHANVWYGLGITYGESGQTAQAIEAYRQALRINPEHANAWYGLGVAYRIDGQINKLTEVYRRLKVLDPKLADEFFSKVVLPQRSSD
jgi:thioredoxin-like negative regulator of GroEL